MNHYLDYLTKEIKKRGDNYFSLAEIIGDGDPETVTLKQNNPCQDIYSVAKVFVVTAIGMCVDRGLLEVTDRVVDALGNECPKTYHPYWSEITIHDLLLHKIDLSHSLDIDCFDANTFTDDYLNFFMNLEWLSKPGEKSRYSDGAFYLLARIAEIALKEPCDNFLWRELFFPLKCREVAWSHCPKGHVIGATGIYLRVEDMVKLGAIYLNKGVYQGKRYLSENWVNRVFENGYELRPDLGNSYSKGGMNGQKLLILPEQNRVVAWQGYIPSPSAFSLTKAATEYND